MSELTAVFPPDIIEKVAKALAQEHERRLWSDDGHMDHMTNIAESELAIFREKRAEAIERAATRFEKYLPAAQAVLTALNFSPASAAVKEEREACAKVADRLDKLVTAMLNEAENISPKYGNSFGQAYPAPQLRKWARYIKGNVAAIRSRSPLAGETDER
jgi:hypothetical protein